jgi:hypothetical protein
VFSRQVLNAVGLVRLTPPKANPFRPFCHTRRAPVTKRVQLISDMADPQLRSVAFYLIGTGVLNAIRPASVMR